MVTPNQLSDLGRIIHGAGINLTRVAFSAVQYTREPADRQTVYDLYRNTALREAANLLDRLHVSEQELEELAPEGRSLVSRLRISAAIRKSGA